MGFEFGNWSEDRVICIIVYTLEPIITFDELLKCEKIDTFSLSWLECKITLPVKNVTNTIFDDIQAVRYMCFKYKIMDSVM